MFKRLDKGGPHIIIIPNPFALSVSQLSALAWDFEGNRQDWSDPLGLFNTTPRKTSHLSFVRRKVSGITWCWRLSFFYGAIALLVVYIIDT